MAVEADLANRRHGNLARRTPDETRRRAHQGNGRMASGRCRDRQGATELHLRAQSQETENDDSDNDPAQLWQYYTQLVAVEEAFRNLKGDLAIRPTFRQDEKRIEAHIFIALLAYCMQITLIRRLHTLVPGLTARSALEKFAAVQMIDVHLPTTCELARGPDADRHVKRLSQFAVEGSLSGAYSQSSNVSHSTISRLS